MTWKNIADQIIHRLAQALSRFGVDARQYEALLRVSIALDFRSTSLITQRGGMGGSRSALAITNVVYVIFSSIMAIFLLAEGSLHLFIWVILTYSMVMLGMAVLIEFGSTVINPDDFLIVGSRPVSSRTYFAVKFSNLGFYILMFGTSLNLIPAILGSFFPESRFYFPVLYFLVALLSALFVAGFIVVLYGLLLRIVNYERFKDIIAYFQIVFSFFMFMGYQLVPRYLERQLSSHAGFSREPWMLATPSLWFASLVELGLGVTDRRTVLLCLAALAAVLIFSTVLVRSVSINYAEYIARMLFRSSSRRSGESPRAERRQRFPVLQMWLRSSEERAIFHFIVTMIRRNRQLKIQLYPNLGMIFVFLAMALVDRRRMVDPFVENRLEMSTITPVVAFLFAALGISSLLPYSDEFQGSWVFSLAPVIRKDRILGGIKKAILTVIFLPVYLISVVVFSFFWPVHHALLYNLYALLGGSLFLEVLLFRLKDLPFTRKIEKGTQNQRLLLVLFFFPVAGLIILLQRKALQSPVSFIVTLAGMVLIGLILGRMNGARYARVLGLPAS